MTGEEKREQAQSDRAKARDNRATVLNRTFDGKANDREAAEVLAWIRSICLADDCPAHACQYDTNRTFYLAGRQSVWREIEQAMKPQPEPTER